MQETEIENDSSGNKVKTEPSKEMAGNKNKETVEEDLNVECCQNDHDYLVAIPDGGPVQGRNESCQVNHQNSGTSRRNSGHTSEETLSVHDECSDVVINDTSNNIAYDELDEEVAAAAEMPSESNESERNMVEIPLDCLKIE